MNLLFLDFETRSRLDVRRVGAYRYAEDPSTEVICAVTAHLETDPYLHREPVDGRLHGILLCCRDEDYTLVAHNIEFEREIMRHKLGILWPWELCIDTAALAARMSLPRKLKTLATYFGLDVGAKEKGEAAILALSKPRTNGEFWTREQKPETFAALEARCVQDVELTRNIFHRLLPLEPSERAVWQLTMKMNERGIPIDLASIPPAQAILERESAPLIAEFNALVGCKVKSYKKVAEALGMGSVDKTAVRKALRDPTVPPRKKRALEIVQIINKASTAKLDAMLDRVCKDGRVHGAFLYCGADRTGRWSANGVQPQNFERGFSEPQMDIAFDCLKTGLIDIAFTGMQRDPPLPSLTPMSTIGAMMRGFMVGKCTVGDKSQIEARVLAWYAGEEWLLDAFRNRADPYCEMASVIYGEKVTKKDKARRFMGKQATLGAGFAMGAGGFHYMLDEVYDVQITEDFAKTVISAYRAKNQKIVKFWDRLGRGILYVVARNSKRVRISEEGLPSVYAGVLEHGGVRYFWIELASGRKLYYAKPEIRPTARGPAVWYFGRDKKGWTMIHTFSGKVCENIVQATARDALALAMLRLRDAGYKLCMTVHDEAVAEGQSDTEAFRELMVVPPPWADGLPIEVEVFSSRRYRK
jgi:DNA polymerase